MGFLFYIIMKRKSISKKVRFEIFKRDSFICQYCGGKPPKIPLEIDHIIAVSKGGENDDFNLITSCFDCNRGKSNKDLNVLPEKTIEKLERMKIAQQQYKEIKKCIENEKKIYESQIKAVESVFSIYNDGYCFSEKFKLSVRGFIEKLGLQEVIHSMEISCNKPLNKRDYVLRYFCGVCWSKIKGI
jgi:hypothetical protein